MEHPSRDELCEFLYQELEPTRQLEVAEHVDRCEACRAVVISWQATREAMQTWRLPDRATPLQARRTSIAMQMARWAIAAMLMLAVGYGIGRLTSPRQPDEAKLRAELSAQLHVELHAELAKFVFDQSAQQQAYQRALTLAARQLDARRVADYASLREDVETVALRTQEKFDAMAFPQPGDTKTPLRDGNQ